MFLTLYITKLLQTRNLLAIQLVSTLCDVENGAGGEEKFLIQAPITNQTQALPLFWDSACHCQQAHLFHSLFHSLTAMQSWAGA